MRTRSAAALIVMLTTTAGCASSQPVTPVAAATTTAHPPSHASSAAAVPTSSSPAAQPTDLPEFDRTGSGTDCTVTYKSSPTGGMLMMVVVDVSGEIIAHVSDKAGNVHRYDMKIAEQEPTGFIDDVPLDQVGDMGAVFAPADGSHQQSCTIKPGG